MSRPPHPSWHALPRAVALLTILSLVPLLIWDAAPDEFQARAHAPLAAIPLASIAVACLAHALVRRLPLADVLKSCGLAAAFLFWAANQLWPEHPRATLFNDIAIALFVVDAFLAIVGFPLSGQKLTTQGTVEAESEPPCRISPERAGEAAPDAHPLEGSPR
jgi:hypothetical protein